MVKVPVGIAQGRFQVIHKGHMEYLLAAKERADYLIIGISDPDPTRSFFSMDTDKDDPVEPFRDPGETCYFFTWFERFLMIREALGEAGIDRGSFDIVPFPVHFPKLLKYYIPMKAPVFVTIYDEWGHEKAGLFRSLGFHVEVLWVREMTERFTTGSEVRRLISRDEEWEHLVPPAVVRVIKELKLDKKLMEAARL